ncbi:hypothetical protein AAFF_G00186940 [Aldrovandia affinis]|uniref:Uncharacterized protein n=1 Tax=Aldrovandia affinis TaxID=143900 RepID=A0AAD7SZ20_9TELE|nr:hypothetical protein AAFF_G00186940 [Aldrovandia affinis]
MYLYKAPCSDIPNPKQKGGQRLDRAPSKYRKQSPVVKAYPPMMCWGGLKPNSPLELKHLEEFLNVHTLSLQDSTRVRTGMAYRYTVQGSAWANVSVKFGI